MGTDRRSRVSDIVGHQPPDRRDPARDRGSAGGTESNEVAGTPDDELLAFLKQL